MTADSPLKLDERTEQLMQDVAQAGVEWGEFEGDALTERTLEFAIDDAENVLRNRIRELIEEALEEERERFR